MVSLGETLARSAYTSAAAADVSVFEGELVAADAVGLARVKPAERGATEGVLALCNGLKVSGINATTVRALLVESTRIGVVTEMVKG